MLTRQTTKTVNCGMERVVCYDNYSLYARFAHTHHQGIPNSNRKLYCIHNSFFCAMGKSAPYIGALFLPLHVHTLLPCTSHVQDYNGTIIIQLLLCRQCATPLFLGGLAAYCLSESSTNDHSLPNLEMTACHRNKAYSHFYT